MKKCFEFSFSFDGNPKVIDTFIPLNTDLDELTSEQEDLLFNECDKRGLERYPYGIHDVGLGSEFNHENEKYIGIFGFYSYEVPEENIDALMAIWKEILTEQLGIETGSIIKKVR